MKTASLLLAMFAGPPIAFGEWKQLPALPDKEGFAALFAGVSHGALIVAGGANFPEKKPWDGGTKVWYDMIFVLEKPDGEWKIAGKLPRPLAYGVSVTHGNTVVCVGGSDSKRHYSDAFRIEWSDGKIVTTPLPPLPKTIANACAALVGDALYVGGGQEKPDSTETLKSLYRMDLAAKEPKWEELEACPGGGRMLSVAASFDSAFWMVGGVDLFAGKDGKAERKYLKDAYRYDSAKGWKRVADLPRFVTAAPSPAPSDATGFDILGGDDAAQLSVAPNDHKGFPKSILHYDAKTEKWIEAGEVAASRVTVPCVRWDQLWVVPSGEAKPGVRSPEVWAK